MAKALSGLVSSTFRKQWIQKRVLEIKNRFIPVYRLGLKFGFKPSKNASISKKSNKDWSKTYPSAFGRVYFAKIIVRAIIRSGNNAGANDSNPFFALQFYSPGGYSSNWSHKSCYFHLQTLCSIFPSTTLLLETESSFSFLVSFYI